MADVSVLPAGVSSSDYAFRGVYSAEILAQVAANTAYRRVLFTADHMQLVAMCVTPDDQEIETEIHETTAQTFFIVSGSGELIYDAPNAGNGTVPLGTGTIAVVPAGVKHRIVNSLDMTSLRLFTIYSQPLHDVQLVQSARTDADIAYHNAAITAAATATTTAE